MSKASRKAAAESEITSDGAEGPAVDAPLVGVETAEGDGAPAGAPDTAPTSDIAHSTFDIDAARAEWAAEAAIATEKAVAEAVAKAKAAFVLENAMVQQAVAAAVEAAKATWEQGQKDLAVERAAASGHADEPPALKLAGSESDLPSSEFRVPSSPPSPPEPMEFNKAAFDAGINKRIGAVRMAALTQAQLLVQVAGILPAPAKAGEDEPAERMLGNDPAGKPNELEVLSQLLAHIDDPDLCMKEAALNLNAQRLENEANAHVGHREMDVCETALREAREVRQNHLPTFERARARLEYLRGLRAQ